MTRLTGDRRSDAVAVAFLVLVTVALFADVHAGLRELYFRDVALYFHPMKRMFRDAVSGGGIPYWNHALAGGQPLAANPAWQTFYPPTWLVLLPDALLGARLLILFHLHLALLAMYALLRSMRNGPAAAALGALAFGLGGTGLSGLAMLPILFELAWLPLTCLFARAAIRRGAPRDFALAALSFAMQILVGEPTMIAATVAVLAAYALHAAPGESRPRLRPLAMVILIALGAALLAAVQLLPAVDHLRDSVRAKGLPFSVASAFSFPPLRMAEFFLPNFLGHLSVDGRTLFWGSGLYPRTLAPYLVGIYPGLIVAVLTMAGLRARLRGSGLAAALAGGSLLLAFGANTPLFGWLYGAGIGRSVRYPEKFVAVALFACIVFAARAVDRLLAGDATVRRSAVAVCGALGLVAFGAAVASTGSWYPAFFVRAWQPRPAEAVVEMLALSRLDWTLACARALVLLLILRRAGPENRRASVVLLGAFAAVDLGLVTPGLAPRVARDFYDPPPLVGSFPQPRDSYRWFAEFAWTPKTREGSYYLKPRREQQWILRNALQPHTGPEHGLRTALDIDFDQTTLQATEDFTRAMWELSTVRRDWTEIAASMSNIRFRGVYRDPAAAEAEADGDARKLQPVRLVENAPYPRYYFADELVRARDREEFVLQLASRPFRPGVAFVDAPPFAPAPGRVRSWRESANGVDIDAEAAGRAFLVMSVTPHKYWQVTVDGRPAASVRTNLGFQGIELGAGRHHVEMRYRNPLVAAGAGVSAAAVLALCLLLRRGRRALSPPGPAH